MPKNYQQDFGSIITSKTSFIDEIINLARKSSIFYLLFGLACCGIELMQTGGAPGGHAPLRSGAPRPPRRPEALTEGLMRVQDKIMRERWFSARQKIGQPEASLGVDYKVTA